MDTGVLDKAIAAHGNWKIKLKDAINGRGAPLDPATIGRDDVCDLGKWLTTAHPGPADAAHLAKVRQLHATFHQVAGEVAHLAKLQKKVEAEASMSAGGKYSKASANLVSALMAWKNTAA